MDTLIAVSRNTKTTKGYLMDKGKDELTLYVDMGWPVALDMRCDPPAPAV